MKRFLLISISNVTENRKLSSRSLKQITIMKEMLVQYAGYHNWANGLLLDLIKSLPETQQRHEVRSSFNSLYSTLLHMLDAENIWWQRMKLQEHVTRPSDSFTGNMKELSNRLMLQS
ncbi:MAG: hypothetical protein EOP49_48120, partial [Sphingobacteriales bacterium]